MDIQTIQYYLHQAKKAKDAIKPIYNEVLRYTDLTYQVNDMRTKELVPNYIDSLIPTSLNDLISFLMSSVFSRTTKWASIQVNDALYRLTNGYEEQWMADDSIQRLNQQLEDVTNVTYTYLNQSNYYSEIGRSLKECVNIGVGAFRITERIDAITPFVFQYVPLDDLFYWEDGFGRPSYIFKYVRNLNVISLQLMFGKGNIKTPKHIKSPHEETFDIIEVITPEEDDGGINRKFTYQVFTTDFQEELMKTTLDYCPIVIFRWDKEGSNPNGLGLSMLGLKTFKNLERAKKQRDESAEKLLNPPLAVYGDRVLAEMINLRPKAVNFFGTQTQMQGPNLNAQVGVTPINTVGSMLPLEQDIQKYEAQIRELYTSHPLGQVEDYKRRSAGESEIRLRMLRQKWSRAFEFIERELLMPTFITPLKILVKQKKIQFDLENLDITLINYKNALATNQEAQSVEKVVAYIQSSAPVIQMAETVGLKVDETLNYFQDNLGIPLVIRMTKEEMGALKQQQAVDAETQQQMVDRATKNDLRNQEIQNDAMALELKQQAMQQEQMAQMMG